jgi:hypothetical protein
MKTVAIALAGMLLASSAWAQETNVTVTARNIPALVLTVPHGARVTPMKDKTVIQTEEMFLHVWPVPDAQSVDGLLPRLGDVIRGDVLQFSATATNVLTIAGAPARHLIGRGVEADDNDPATADIVVFAVGGHVFVACVHGEANDASKEREPMLRALKTARTP